MTLASRGLSPNGTRIGKPEGVTKQEGMSLHIDDLQQKCRNREAEHGNPILSQS